MKASQAELSLALGALRRQDQAEALASVASALRINSQNAAATSLALSIILKGEWWWPLGKPMTHEAAVRSAAFSNDGQRVLTVSYDSADTTDGAEPAAPRLWDATSGKPLGEPMKHEHAITSAAFSRDACT